MNNNVLHFIIVKFIHLFFYIHYFLSLIFKTLLYQGRTYSFFYLFYI